MTLCLPGRAGTAVTQVRSNEQIGQTATVVAEKGKEYGVKTFSFLKSVYANAAAQVETVAQEHGYKVDLGERLCMPSPLQHYAGHNQSLR